MSTRCQIVVQDSPIYVYKHSDGYPEDPCGVLAFLRPFVADFFKWRGHDPSYFTAQILRHWAIYDRDVLKSDLAGWDLDMKPEERARYKGSEFTGYGLDLCLHSDISYLYVVTSKGVIEVRKPTEAFYNEANTVENTEILEIWAPGATSPELPPKPSKPAPGKRPPRGKGSKRLRKAVVARKAKGVL